MNAPSGATYGMLSVMRFGYAGRACATDWDDNAANVSCRQMGFAGGVRALQLYHHEDIQSGMP